MGRFEIKPAPLGGLFAITRSTRIDERGYFERIFCETELARLFGGNRIVQINTSMTRVSGAVRGMHFQHPPNTEKKLVSCLRGEIFDVAVDLRQKSPTFLQWHAEVLSEKNHRALFIPEGFAHGFQTLTEDCALLYAHTAPYAPQNEGAVNAIDPRIGISWPKPVSEMSSRDKDHAFIGNDFQGIAL
jgi:dTDP-4-dehydrorhamnose 3,5-epimerase